MSSTLSLVMAARNADAFIGEALSSIPAALSGAAASYEVVLADGASRDHTLDIARSHPRVRIVSTSDSGIYDGMNKALHAAQGDFILILNSDDVLLPKGLTRLLTALAAAPGAPFATGAAEVRGADGSVRPLRNLHALSAASILFGVPSINARLIRRAWIARHGLFRTDAGLGADRELLLRWLRTGAKGVAVKDPVYAYRSHAGSQTLAGDAAGRLRVYAADLELADVLLADATLSQAERRTVKAFRALALLKMRRGGGDAGRAGLRLPPIAPADTARGLLHYARWRGRHSGF